MSKAEQKSVQGWTKNGMRFDILPQNMFQEKMAAVVVRAGANHIFWKTKDGKEIAFPQGTAHFIEHKLFQQKWGDAFPKFVQQGASANAFTDGEKTVYYFSCREHFMENLKLLLDFVQHPFFTEEDTEREKKIITSEISMYDDDPGWAAYYQLLRGMYQVHPIKNQIAGTAETVAKISRETLQQAYEAYYTTERMNLVCTGNIPVKQVQAAAERVEKEKQHWSLFPKEQPEILEKYLERSMGLQCPLFQIGFKLPVPEEEKYLKNRILMGFLLELLAGESSAFFQRAYEKELLDEPLGGAYFCGEGYAFAAFSGAGEEPEEIAELLGKYMKKMQKKGVSEEDFQRIQKKQLGRFLRRMDSVSGLCMGQIEWTAAGASAEEVLRLLKTVKKEEAEKLLQNDLSMDTMVLSVMR